MFVRTAVPFPKYSDEQLLRSIRAGHMLQSTCESVNHNQSLALQICKAVEIMVLVGGLEHFYLSIYWEFHHPN